MASFRWPKNPVVTMARSCFQLSRRLDGGVVFTRRVGPGPAGEVLCVAIRLIGILAVDSIFGSNTRDHLVGQVQAKLRAVMGSGGIVERIGDGDFVIISASSTNDRAVVSRLLEAALEPLASPLGEVAVGYAAGIAVGDAASAMEVVQRAICNLEAAARRGAGSVEWIDELPEQADDVGQRRMAVPTGEPRADTIIRLQPVVSLATGAVVEYEASARWRAAACRGDANDERASLASCTRSAPGCELVLLASALDFLANVRSAQSTTDSRVSLNVSADRLASPSFASKLLGHLERAEVPTSAVQLELTDRFDISRRSSIQRTTGLLRAEGVRFALDDFGRDATDLGTLSDVDFDAIKLAPQLIAADASDGDALLQSLIRLATEAGIDVIATGVESPEQHERLVHAGCPYGKGPLYGHPEPHRVGGRPNLATAPAWQGFDAMNKRVRAIQAIVARGCLGDGSVNAVLRAILRAHGAEAALFATNQPAPNHLVLESRKYDPTELTHELARHVRAICEAVEPMGTLFPLAQCTYTPDEVVAAQVVDKSGNVLGALIVVASEQAVHGLSRRMGDVCDRLAAALMRPAEPACVGHRSSKSAA